MRIADRLVLDRAQAEALRGVVGRLLQPAIVEHQHFGLAVFEEQFAVVGALERAARGSRRDLRGSRPARSIREEVDGSVSIDADPGCEGSTAKIAVT